MINKHMLQSVFAHISFVLPFPCWTQDKETQCVLWWVTHHTSVCYLLILVQ